MRIIGLDLGSKTCGVAISDSLGIVATPVDTLRFRPNDLHHALALVQAIIKEKEASKVVLGLPKNMDGSIGFQGEYCLTFQKMLQDELGIEVILIDEDNLKAEGVTSKKIQSLLAKETKELTETEVN